MRRKSKRYENLGAHERSFIPEHDEGYGEILMGWINGWMMEEIWALPREVLFNDVRDNEIRAYASALANPIDSKILTLGDSNWEVCEDEEAPVSCATAFYSLEEVLRQHPLDEIPEQEDRELVLKHLPSDEKKRLGLTEVGSEGPIQTKTEVMNSDGSPSKRTEPKQVPEEIELRFFKSGNCWHVGKMGREGTFRDLIGFGMIHFLLDNPDQTLTAQQVYHCGQADPGYSDSQRPRKNVQKAITRALKEIHQELPELRGYLNSETIATGYSCRHDTSKLPPKTSWKLRP